MDNALAQSSEDNKTPKTYLGKYDKKHQDWFDSNNQMLRDLMAERDQTHQRVLQIRSTRSAVEAYKDAWGKQQKYTRARKSEWWEMKVAELQIAADRNNTKGVYSALKEVYGQQTN